MEATLLNYKNKKDLDKLSEQLREHLKSKGIKYKYDESEDMLYIDFISITPVNDEYAFREEDTFEAMYKSELLTFESFGFSKAGEKLNVIEILKEFISDELLDNDNNAFVTIMLTLNRGYDEDNVLVYNLAIPMK